MPKSAEEKKRDLGESAKFRQAIAGYECHQMAMPTGFFHSSLPFPYSSPWINFFTLLVIISLPAYITAALFPFIPTPLSHDGG